MINKNFKDIYDNVGSNIQDASTSMKTIIKRYANDIYRDILKRVDFKMMDDDYSFSTTSQDNILPDNFGNELVVLDTTNNRELSYKNTQKYVKENPTTAYTSSSPMYYDIIERGYLMQPSATSTISIVSSSGSDAGGYVQVRGISGNVEITETVTTTGTTPVVTTASFSKVISFSKSAGTVGAITITSGTDELAVIPPQAVGYTAKILKLLPAPASEITIQIPYNIDPQPMVNDYDVPYIDVGDIIEIGATMMSLRYKRQYAKASQMEMQYEKALNNYIFSVERKTNRGQFLNITPYSRETV